MLQEQKYESIICFYNFELEKDYKKSLCNLAKQTNIEINTVKQNFATAATVAKI